ncbi:MAG TPA: hypothetical protein DD666_15460 [Advenella kashmirensis]|uniref:Uncharacterized protein n=1 Tax=Advenella kashmirensis TaxID=310575 RepID=A0A356LIR3_9BURK|nr:hypothetical protein [Advenella kashmirensis]
MRHRIDQPFGSFVGQASHGWLESVLVATTMVFFCLVLVYGMFMIIMICQISLVDANVVPLQGCEGQA